MTTNLKEGDRVELHPATDAWMRGQRYGTVVKVTRATRNAPKGIVHVLPDVDRIMRMDPQLLTLVRSA